MQKIDLTAWVGSFGSVGFLYINMTNIIESVQVANVLMSTVGTIGSTFLVAIKISKYYKNRNTK